MIGIGMPISHINIPLPIVTLLFCWFGDEGTRGHAARFHAAMIATPPRPRHGTER